ncbi:MAG: hypothetical protein R3B49_00650 [Phycisphaerales bacterium]
MAITVAAAAACPATSAIRMPCPAQVEEVVVVAARFGAGRGSSSRARTRRSWAGGSEPAGCGADGGNLLELVGELGVELGDVLERERGCVAVPIMLMSEQPVGEVLDPTLALSFEKMNAS